MKVTFIHEENTSESAPNRLLPEPGHRRRFSGLIAQLFDKSRKSSKAAVMLTSPHRKAGVSFICTSLAAELAVQGERVLLLDAHALLTVRALSSRAVTGLCKRIGPHTVWVLGMEEVAGWCAGSEDKSGAIATLLRDLEREFSCVLIDAPALSVGSDANLLATSVYGTVIVARTNLTRNEELKRACEALTTFGGRVLGSVFNAHKSAETCGVE